MKKLSLISVVVFLSLFCLVGSAFAVLSNPVKISNTATVEDEWCSGQYRTVDPDGIAKSTEFGTLSVTGDRWNSYIWSLCCLEECEGGDTYLWAGTLRNPLYKLFDHIRRTCLSCGPSCQFPVWLYDALIEKIFCGNVPTGWHGCKYPMAKDFQAEIWRWKIGASAGDWDRVYKSECADWPDENCAGNCDDCEYNPCDSPEQCWNRIPCATVDCDYFTWCMGPDWGFPSCLSYEYDELGKTIGNIYFGSYFNEHIVDHARVIGFDYLWDEDEPETVFIAKNQDDEAVMALAEFVWEQEGETQRFMVVGTEGRNIYTKYAPADDNICWKDCEWCEIAGTGDLGGSLPDGQRGDVWDMIQYEGSLYVVVASETGFRLYRGWPRPEDFRCDCCPEWNWEPIVSCLDYDVDYTDISDPIYPSGMDSRKFFAANLEVCDDCLYIGTMNDYLYLVKQRIDGWGLGASLKNAVTSDYETRAKNLGEDNLKKAKDLLGADGYEPTDEEIGQFAYLLDEFFGEEAIDVNADPKTLLNSSGGNGNGGFIGDLFLLHMLMTFCPGEIYRFCEEDCNNTEWEMVIGDAWGEVATASNFEKTTTGVRAGFGSNWNSYIWDMKCCNGDLYASTFDVLSLFHGLTECWFDDTCELWTLLSCFPEISERVVCLRDWVQTHVLNEAHGNPTGFDLYAIEKDGLSGGVYSDKVTKITDDGFGDPYNMGAPALACCEDCLYVGTANPFWGGQVWELCGGECIPEPVAFTDEFSNGTWDLEVTGCECGDVVSGDLEEVINPDADGAVDGEVAFLQLTLEGDVCIVEICVTFDMCPSGDKDIFWWNGEDWVILPDSESTGDVMDGTACITFPNSQGIDPATVNGLTFGVGPEDSSVFEGAIEFDPGDNGDDDDDDDNGDNGEPGGDDDDNGTSTPTTSSSSGGCNVGTGAAVLLLLVPLGVLWFKRF